jgi:hypothetical protein
VADDGVTYIVIFVAGLLQAIDPANAPAGFTTLRDTLSTMGNTIEVLIERMGELTAEDKTSFAAAHVKFVELSAEVK